MINKDEVKAKAEEFAINVSDVERDYVYGWLLAGIFQSSALRDLLILKGGNGLRKAYFENTRFSKDLDFATQTKVDASMLHSELNKVCEFVEAATRVTFAYERNRVEPKEIGHKDKTIYEARLYFKDFYGNPESITLKAQLDITEFDRILLPIQERQLIHPYSDSGDCRVAVRCLKLEEMLAAKLKCLLQRQHSFDLYDYVYAIFINRELAVNTGEIVSSFLKKTVFAPAPGVVVGLLTGLPFAVFRGVWNKYVVAPASSLFDFETAVTSFTENIKALFGRFTAGVGRVAYFPSQLRNPIMEAGANLNLLRVVYAGVPREVEPYSLVFKSRKDGYGQEYLYVYDRTGGRDTGPGLKSFVHDKFQSVELLPTTFEPRFPIELARAGEYSGRTYFSRPFSAAVEARRPRSRRMRSSGLIYVLECGYCHKRFRRLTFSTQIRRHRDRYGNQCYGRVGHLVEKRYAG